MVTVIIMGKKIIRRWEILRKDFIKLIGEFW